MKLRGRLEASDVTLSNKFHTVDRCCSHISGSNHSAILAMGGGTITAAEPSEKTDNF